MKNLNVLSTVIAFAALGWGTASFASAAGFDVHAYSFTKAPFIPPTLVEDLISRVSDGGDQVVAINLTDSVTSNRYYVDEKALKVTPAEHGGNPLVAYRTEAAGTEPSEFEYQLIGKTRSGVYVLSTDSSGGGGSGVFRQLLLVTLDDETAFDLDETTNEVRRKNPHWVIRKLCEIPLGDRYAGHVAVKGDEIHIDKDARRDDGYLAKARVIKVVR